MLKSVSVSTLLCSAHRSFSSFSALVEFRRLQLFTVCHEHQSLSNTFGNSSQIFAYDKSVINRSNMGENLDEFRDRKSSIFSSLRPKKDKTKKKK